MRRSRLTGTKNVSFLEDTDSATQVQETCRRRGISPKPYARFSRAARS